MAASIYQLPTINADTNAGTGAMAGASQSFSHAGTVFGELRKSILDEEQRAIENAFKEKQMAEQIRQFNEQLGWDKDKFGQDLVFRREQLGETSRHNRASEALQGESNSISRQAHALQQARFNREVDLYNQGIAAWNAAIGKMQQEEQAVKDYTKQEAKDMKDVWATGRAAWQNVTDLDKRIANAKDANELQYLMGEYNKNMDTYNTAKGVYQTYQANHMPKVTTPVGGTDIEKQRYVQMAMMANGVMPLPTPYDAGASSIYEVNKALAKQQQDFAKMERKAQLDRERAMAVERMKLNGNNKNSVVNTWAPDEQQAFLQAKLSTNQMLQEAGLRPYSDKEFEELYRAEFNPHERWLVPGKATSGIFSPAFSVGEIGADKLNDPSTRIGMFQRKVIEARARQQQKNSK